MLTKPDLKASVFHTKLGKVLVIGDEEGLYLVEFFEKSDLELKIEQFKHQTKSVIGFGTNIWIESIIQELESYFQGTLKVFKTPVHLIGTPFQKSVWEGLRSIQYGQTRSYAEQSKLISRKGAFRAVAKANGANRLAIIIPCHRVIYSNGTLGGYAGGLMRKKWLLDHEKERMS